VACCQRLPVLEMEELTANVLASRIPIERSEHPYANNDPSELIVSLSQFALDAATHLTSKTVTGLVATSLLRTTSHLPNSSSSSFSFPLTLELLSSSAVWGALLGPATRVKVATKALRGPPLFDGFEALRTAWIVGAEGCGENLESARFFQLVQI